MKASVRSLVTALLVLAFGTSAPVVSFGADRLTAARNAIAAQRTSHGQVAAIAPAPRLLAHDRIERHSPNACLAATRPDAVAGDRSSLPVAWKSGESTSADTLATRGRAPPAEHSSL